jgi:hypothetical protein
MNANKNNVTVAPRQIKAVIVAVLAILGITLAGIAFGLTSDQVSLAQEIVNSVRNGPVGQVVTVLYYLI